LLTLLLGSPSCLFFRFFPALFFLGSPLGFGLQSLCVLLSLLTGFGLFHSSLFWRHPWLIQRFDDLSAETLDLLSDCRRLNIKMTQLTPIDILTCSYSCENNIIAPFGLVLEHGNRNIKNWKNEVVSTECFFASEKRFCRLRKLFDRLTYRCRPLSVNR
jgi:hypothetical protein